MSRIRTTAVALLAAALSILLASAPAAADPQDDKARVDREIAKTKAALEAASERVAAAAAEYEKANQQLPAVERRHAEAEAALAKARDRMERADRTARQAEARLAQADKDVAVALERVERSREEIGRYAASVYMGRDLASTTMLLGVRNPADFVAGLTYVEQVARERQRALDANIAARAEAERRKDIQVERAREAHQARLAAERALRAAAQAEAEAAAAEAEVVALVRQREQALRVAEEERAETEARYRELLAESARIAEQIRAMAQGGSGVALQPGQRLPMPVDGWKTSDFGMRLDPIYNVWRLHAGVDLAAPGGAPIWAVQSGEVFRAGWNGGYGNYTFIYHGTYQGKGFASCYAHQSEILVKVGQQVRQGQLIGRVGTTGASTGNHLHFEIRLDGEPVDPLPYLPACLC